MDQYEETVRALYEAATSARNWPSALAMVSRITGSWFTQLVGIDKKNGRIAFSVQCESAPVDGVMDYVRHYHRLDPHTNQALQQPLGIPYNGERVVPGRLVADHPFYRDFFLPYGARYTVGAKIVDDDTLFSAFAVIRRPEQSAYSLDDESLLKRISFHMSAAIGIMTRVTAFHIDAGIGRALLERTSRPSFLIEATKATRFANRAGRNVLEAATVVEERAGFICCPDPASDARLIERLDSLQLGSEEVLRTDTSSKLTAHGLSEAAERSAGDRGERDAAGQARLAFPLWDTKLERPVPACLWSVRPEGTMGAFGSAPVAILTIASPNYDSVPDPVVLASMFDLTPAETRVAAGLCEGSAAKSVSKRLGIGEDAVRYHIRNLLRKAGVANQRELITALRSSMQF